MDRRRTRVLIGFNDGEFKNFLKTIYTPGHAKGSCSFYTEYFENQFCLLETPCFNPPLEERLAWGDFEKIKKSIRATLLLTRRNRVITGHSARLKYIKRKINICFWVVCFAKILSIYSCCLNPLVVKLSNLIFTLKQKGFVVKKDGSSKVN